MRSTKIVRNSFRSRARKALAALLCLEQKGFHRDTRPSHVWTFEKLEVRRVLNGHFDKMATEVDGALVGMQTVLESINSLTKLPLINKEVDKIVELTNSLRDLRTELYDVLEDMPDDSSESEFRDALFEVLEDFGVPSADQIGLDISAERFDVTLDLVFSAGRFDSDIGLGIPSIPFKPASGTSGKFEIGVEFQDLNFGYDFVAETAYFQRETGQLQLSLDGYLPSQEFTVGLGFLQLDARDNTSERDVHLTLTSDISSTGIDTPVLGGVLDLKIELNVGIQSEGMPDISTLFVLNWPLNTVNPGDVLSASWGSPTLEFRDVTLGLGSVLGSITQPIARHVKEIVEPLKDVFDLLEKPIPGLTAVSNEVGGPPVTLLTLVNTLPQVLPPQLVDMVRVVETMRNYYQKINLLAGNDGTLHLGSFPIVGSSGNLLTDTASKAGVFLKDALGNILPDQIDWSSLVPGPDGVPNLVAIKDQIRALLPGVGDEVVRIFEQLTKSENEDGLKFSFPIIDNTSDIVLGMLLGKDQDLVLVDGQLHFDFEKEIRFKIITGITLVLSGDASFDAKATVGYDTRGLREAVGELFTGGGFRTTKLANGLWIGKDTQIDAHGKFELAAEFGIQNILVADVAGGFDIDLQVNISNNHNPPLEKIRPFNGDLGNRLFSATGEMTAYAEVGIKIGFEAPEPIGFVGYEDEWPFAEAPMFKFQSDSIPIPLDLISNPVPAEPNLFTWFPELGQLQLNVGENREARNHQPGIIDENFIVKNLGRYEDPVTHLPYDIFDITFQGETERFKEGVVSRFVAHMGEGNDTLKIIDTLSPVFYSLKGGNGNDNIDVDGNVDARIFGDDGEDILDAGNGLADGPNRPTSVHGGRGADKITFGDGILSNMAIEEEFLIIRDEDDDGVRDTVTIDNSRSRINSRYSFVSNTGDERFDVRLVMTEDFADNVRVVFMTNKEMVHLHSGYGDDLFSGVPPTNSVLQGGAGDDHVDMGPNLKVDSINPFFSGIFEPSFRFEGSSGYDTVFMSDTFAELPRDYFMGIDPFSGTTSYIQWQESSSQSLQMKMTGVEDTSFTVDQLRTIVVNGWDESSLHLQAGEVKFRANESMVWDGSVDVVNTPKITLDDSDFTRNTTVAGIDSTGPHFQTSSGGLFRVTFDEFSTNFFFNVDYAFVNASLDLQTKPWNVEFTSPAYGRVDIIGEEFDANGAIANHEVEIEAERFRIGTKSFDYSRIEEFRFFGGLGNDHLQIDDDLQFIKIVFFGGNDHDGNIAGNNTVSIDRSATTTDTVWDFIDKNVVVRGLWGGFELEQHSVSSAQYLGGIGTDSFLANGDLPLNIEMYGGMGWNSLLIDDQNRVTNLSYYEIYEDRIRSIRDLVHGSDFRYYGMSSVTLNGSDIQDQIYIHGVSADIASGSQFRILGNGGSDFVKIDLFNYEGTPTLGGQLSISGGADSDQVFVDDSTNVQGSNYQFYNQLGQTIVSGFYDFGVGIGVDSDVDQLNVNAGLGDDSFIIFSYQNYTTALNIQANRGDDNLAFVPVFGSIFSNVSKYSQFTFEGGGGSDSFSFNNITDVGPALYERQGTRLTAFPLTGDFPLSMDVAQFESMAVTGGSSFDLFFVDALSSNESISLNGGGGFGSFYVGQRNQNTQTIRGQIVIDGGSGGGNLFVNDGANTTGTTAHFDSGDTSWLGNAPGDTLFGPGGSLQFKNLTDDPESGAGISLALGTGPDTIYAAPQVATTLTIAGNSPNEGLGDRLFLALEGVQNPDQVAFGSGAGRLTSSNRKNVSWTGIEGLDLIYVAPASFTVNNTLDSGPGSLRQAILDANARPNGDGPDVIRFALSGANTYSIRPLSELPSITDPVVLDATTQSGYTDKPVVELDGSLAGSSNGLVILSGFSTVRGLAINRFEEQSHIAIRGGSNNVIQGNYIGTTMDGSDVHPMTAPTKWGIAVYATDDNLIGTNGDGINDSMEGNLISGHAVAGILFDDGESEQWSDGNVVAGNRIGTSADGNRALANGRMGIFMLSNGEGNRIGTNADGISDTVERNLISGNVEAGIYLGTNGNTVVGNYIGTNAEGTAAVPNGIGITIQSAHVNRVGGEAAAESNIIAYNNNVGVSIGNGSGNSVLGNSIYANGEIGIDLNAAEDPAHRVTPNDHNDADSGPNNLQNFPVLSLAQSSGSATFVVGSLRSAPLTTYRIELFASSNADPSGHGEGQYYIGYLTVTTDASGFASFAPSFEISTASGYFVSSTATDPSGNTSEFSSNIQVVESLPSNVVVLQEPVTNKFYVVSSPVGTSLTVETIASPSGTELPNGVVFPFGFLSLVVHDVAPGASADVTITGLDVTDITQYFNYGATPANPTAHWYSFLYNSETDNDNAIGTGMEVIDGQIVLHLMDGSRGDDDLIANGMIVQVGGPALNRLPVAVNDAANTFKNTPVSINVLGNDQDFDGAMDATTVTIVGSAGYGTTTINATTGAITYMPNSDYIGPDSFTYQVKDNLGSVSNIATVSIDVKPLASISGMEYLDVTGNGLTIDDLPLPGVKVYLDINNNGVWNSGEPTQTSLADGTYLFADLNAGSYKVRQVTPNGFVTTAPVTTNYHSVVLATGQYSGGIHFANAALGNLTALSNVVYVINGITPVTDLRGRTQEGDTVQVMFTIAAGSTPQRFTLVSYTAPAASFDANSASRQTIFDTDSGLFGPGTHTLNVSNPHSYFQVDFVGGFAIDRFGPANSNIFYSAQNRLISADNGGTRPLLTSPATLTGSVYRDANNNGMIDQGELPIAGVKVTAVAGSISQSVVTDVYGVYTFDNLPAGTYTLIESQPSDYADGKESLGDRGGILSNDRFRGIVLGPQVNATGYHFGERQTVGSAVAGNQTQTAAWWNTSTGQSLIRALNGGPNAKNLGNWLSTNFGNLFGSAAGGSNNLANKTNSQVAALYATLYANSARRPESEFFALALSMYVTNSGLAGTTAASAAYGFSVSSTGLGASTVNVGTRGAAFGIKENTVLTVAEFLSRANIRARKGKLWDMNGDGGLNAAENLLRNQVASLFSVINNK